ncbi:MAG: hypothetical protein ACKV2V_09220 [Blastocatellia bacterium]
MNQKITILPDDAYGQNEMEPEYDLAELIARAKAEGREYRGPAALRALMQPMTVTLPPDLAAFFKTPEAVNEALRRVMDGDEQKAA